MSSSTDRATLGPDVEAFQVPPEDAPENWQENLFFILWDDTADLGFLAHVQRVPGQQEQEARVVVVVEGEVASSTLVSPYGPSLVPELAFDVVEPFRCWRVGLEASLTAGHGPLGMLTLDGPGSTSVSLDLRMESDLPAVDFAAALDEMVGVLHSNADGPQMGRQEHYEQGGRWTGTLRMGDRTVQGSGLFVRDHSWGVRSEQQDFRAFWTASCLDGGRTFCNAIGIHSGDRVVGIGAVADRDGVRFTREVSAAFGPEPGIASYEGVEVRFGSGVEATLTARTRRHLPIPLPHSGPGRYDNNAMSDVRMGDLTGFGVMEWASTFSPTEAELMGKGGTWS